MSRTSLSMPVELTLDQNSCAKLIKSVQSVTAGTNVLQKHLESTKKTAADNIRGLNDISEAAKKFSKTLSDETKRTASEVSKLNSKLSEAYEESDKLQEQFETATTAKRKQEIASLQIINTTVMKKLNTEIESFTKANRKQIKSVADVAAGHQEYLKSLQNKSKFSRMDTAKGSLGGVAKMMHGDHRSFHAGAKELGSSAKQGLESHFAKKKLAAEEAGQSAAVAGGMLKALGAVGAIAAGVAVVAEILMAMSEAHTKLNKTLLDGVGIAGDLGVSGEKYKATINDMRTSIMESGNELMKFGVNSEDAMKSVNAFAKSASGSIVQTQAQFGRMGTDMNKGIVEFAKNAKVFGKALGIESTEIASMMGDLVSDVGYDAMNVQKVMGDVVKQASQSGLPVHKFTNIFKEVLPNIDLFTNRIEDLTGMIKMLSKGLDPKAIKNFMNSFGKNFEQMGFKQRLKMQLVNGPGATKESLSGSINRGVDSIAEELKAFPEVMSEFKKAMAGPNSEKAMADVAALAQAAGVDGAKIGAMQSLARTKKLNEGSVLDRATAMKDSDLYSRVEQIKSLGGKFTNGSVEGLGEHVASQLGLSEADIKAVRDLAASSNAFASSIKKYGMTSSISINEGLKQTDLFKNNRSKAENAGLSDKDLLMKIANDPKQTQELEKAIMMASAKQIEKSSNNKKEAPKVEEIMTENVKATTSIGDTLKNVFQVIFEKLLAYIGDFTGAFNSFAIGAMDFFFGNNKNKDTRSTLTKWSEDSSTSLKTKSGREYYRKANDSLSSDLAKGTNTKDMLDKRKQLFSVKDSPEGAVNYDALDDIRNAAKESGLINEKVFKQNTGTLKRVAGSGGGALGNFEYEGGKTISQATPDEIIEYMKTHNTEAEVAKFISALEHKKAARMKDSTGYVDGSSFDSTELGKKIKDSRDAEVSAKSDHIDARTGIPTVNTKVKGSGTAEDPYTFDDQSLPGGQVPGGKAPPLGEEFGPTLPPKVAASAATAAETTATATTSIDEVNKKMYEASMKVYTLLDSGKTGFIMNDSWMKSKYGHVMKESTLTSFRTALTEFLVTYLKAQDSAEFKKALIDPANADTVLGMGAGGDLAKATAEKIEEEKKKRATIISEAGTKARGGVVPSTGLYALSQGELVTPNISGMGGGGKTFNITVNAAPSMTPGELSNFVQHVIDSENRRS